RFLRSAEETPCLKAALERERDAVVRHAIVAAISDLRVDRRFDHEIRAILLDAAADLSDGVACRFAIAGLARRWDPSLAPSFARLFEVAELRDSVVQAVYERASGSLPPDLARIVLRGGRDDEKLTLILSLGARASADISDDLAALVEDREAPPSLRVGALQR